MVKNKDKLKQHITSDPLFFSESTSLLHLQLICILPHSPNSTEGLGRQSVHDSSSLLLFLLHTLLCSSVSPSHRLQSFRVNMLQSGVSTSHCSCQEIYTCSSMASSMGCRETPAPLLSLLQAAGETLLKTWSTSSPSFFLNLAVFTLLFFSALLSSVLDLS